MLRIAFDTALESPTATYHVPFGALARPTDRPGIPRLRSGST